MAVLMQESSRGVARDTTLVTLILLAPGHRGVRFRVSMISVNLPGVTGFLSSLDVSAVDIIR